MRKIFSAILNLSLRNREGVNNRESDNGRNRRGIVPPDISSDVACALSESRSGVTPQVEQDYTTVVNISLQNLRVGNESDNSSAFCKLDLVKNETCKGITDANNQHETVEVVLIAEYVLQDELGLPVNHTRPMHMGAGNMSTTRVNQIKEAVLAKLLQKDGVHVIDFFSSWQPWVKHVVCQEKNQADFELLHSTYTDNLAATLENPNLLEVSTLEIPQNFMNRHRAWKSELVGQKSREFLVNHRADCLLDSVSMPFHFTQGAAR